VDDPFRRHLPRLEPEWYRGLAFVHWTPTIEHRATGWLTPDFNRAWQWELLHACARYKLACPTFVLMPDHLHFLWLGLNEAGSDQQVAIEFLTKNLRPHLSGVDFQRQPFDQVLRAKERNPDTFLNVAGYILDNPVRAGLVGHRAEWPYSGCCVPGYPDLNVHGEDYWELFWRIYNKLVDHR